MHEPPRGPLSVADFLEVAWLLGHLFDSIGRRPMITFTYGLSGLLMAATAVANRATASKASASLPGRVLLSASDGRVEASSRQGAGCRCRNC